MGLRCKALLSSAALAITLLIVGCGRSRSVAATHPAARQPSALAVRNSTIAPESQRDPLTPVADDRVVGPDPTAASLEELAMRDPAAAVSAAVSVSDRAARAKRLAAVLRGWGRVDLISAGNWIVSQAWIDHREGFAALFSGSVDRPEEAFQFAQEIARVDSADAGVCAEAFISALCDAGKYEDAARFGANTAGTHLGDRVTAVYRQWSEQAPEVAWKSAVALEDGSQRLAALEGAIRGWSQSNPRALAEMARQLPEGPERTIALTMGLRAWLDQDLDGASDWIMRWETTGTLASVNIRLLLEE